MRDLFDLWDSGHPGVNQRSRTWTQDGVQYRVSTASFISPGTTGLRARARGLETGLPSRHYTSPDRISARTGLHGSGLAAFDVFRAMLDTNTSHRQRSPAGLDRSASRIRVPAEDADTFIGRSGHRSTPFNESVNDLREKRGESSRRFRQSNHGLGGRQGAQRADHRHESHRHERAEPRSKRRNHASGQSDGEGQAERASHDRLSSDRYEPMIEALQNAIKFQRQATETCRRQLTDLANQGSARSEDLQTVLSELRKHEAAFESATQNLRDVERKQRRDRRQRPTNDDAPRTRSSTLPIEEFLDSFSSPPLRTSSNTPRRSVPIFEEDFDDFDSYDFRRGDFFDNTFRRLFEDFTLNLPFEHAQFTFTDSATGNTRGNGHSAHDRHSPVGRAPKSTTPAHSGIPTPPVNVLQPDEAKRLYQDYNAHWNALSPSGSNVLYPARGLRASALNARDTIWAPRVISNVTTWSEEAVMQANVQAFFLGVVGLKPSYRQANTTSKVEMGFDKSQASASQVKELIEILKKEKSRWHSDRLGRRNGNAGGINTALQKDERARAVFHAVCELMETAQ